MTRVPLVADRAKVFANTKLIPYFENKECASIELIQNSEKVRLIERNLDKVMGSLRN